MNNQPPSINRIYRYILKGGIFIYRPIAFPEEELWKPISKLSVSDIDPDTYYVSNFGRVFSKISNTIITPIDAGNGYYRIKIKGKLYLLHRIVMTEFHYIENCESMQVNHRYGDKSDNFDENLEWCTPSQNIQHAFDTGLKTQYRGEDCSWATITNEQAEAVARMITEQKYSRKEISEITNVPMHIIHNISCGTTWKDVYDKYNLKDYKRDPRYGFSDEELHKLCKYFEDNKFRFSTNSDLFRHALMDLFNVKFTQNMSASLSRIYNHKTRKHITDKYDY